MQEAALGGRERVDLRRQPGGAPAAARLELAAALRGDPHARDPPVGVVAGAFDEALLLEGDHHLGDGRGAQLLLLGEVTERDRPVALDDAERRDERGREAGVVLLAQQPGETVDGRPEPVGELDGVGRGGHDTTIADI